jgi:glycosyltransferase involved in cell wall biosynthesis
MMPKNETRLRLLIITPSLACGGSEKFVSMVCNHINTEKFSVCLLVINNADNFHKISNPDIEIINLRKNRVLSSLQAIKKAVKNFKPDIIFSTANHLNVYLAVFKNQFNKNIHFIAREANMVSINSKEAKMPALYSRLIKKYYKRFDAVICQSASMQQDLVQHYHIDASKTSIIHNAVNIDFNNQIKQPNKKPGGLFKFITVARLSEQKGIERLIHAVGLLTISFKFFIIGEGNKRNELQKLIEELQLQDKVFLAGQKKNPFMGMEDADLFLMGSYYEGFPNVLLEAGANGIPAVAFNAPGGIAEIITDAENGLLVTDNDLIGFAAAINKALAINFNRFAIIQTTAQRFSVSKMMTALENCFLNAAQNK